MNKHSANGGLFVALITWIVIAAMLIGVLVYAIIHSQVPWKHDSAFFFPNWGNIRMQEIKKDVDMNEISKITAEGSFADIHITDSGDGQIHVDVRAPMDKSENAVTVDNGTLSVNTTLPISLWIWNFYPHSSIEIALPSSYSGDLDASSASGDISLPDTLHVGRLTLHSASGNLRGSNVKASYADIKDVSGDVRLQSLDCPSFLLNQVSGDINLGNVSGAGKISLISGNLTAGIGNLNGVFTSSSVSGNINLSLPDDITAEVNLDSLSGDVNSNFPLQFSKSHSAEGILGKSSSNSLSAHTTSGNISLTKS